MSLLRLAGAWLASSLAGAVAGSGALTAWFAVNAPDPAGSWLSGFIVFGFVLLIYAGAVMLVLGVPAHLLFARVGWRSAWVYGLAGVIVGLGVGLLMRGLAEPVILVTGPLIGLVSTLTFWAIARPDRQR